MENSLRTMIATLAITLTLSANSPSCSNRNTVETVIWHTNDIHSHFEPDATHPENLGGLARLATLIDERRSANRKKNQLLLDAGDWSEGHAPFVVDGGINTMNLMNQMGYDATVIGNHDFYLGPNHLLTFGARRPETLNLLTANFDTTLYANGQTLDQTLLPYKVFNKDNLRIAVIGLSTFEVTYASYLEPIRLLNPITKATTLAQNLHAQGIEVIILLSHNSFEYNKVIAQQVPWVNGVISGHSHYMTQEPVYVQNAGRTVFVVEAEKWGHYLGEIHLSTDLSTLTSSVTHYQLIPVTPTLAERPDISAAILKDDSAINEKLTLSDGTSPKDAIGHIHFDSPQDDERETALGNLLADAYRSTTSSDIALEVSQFVAQGVKAGPIRGIDIFNSIPYIYDPQVGKAWQLSKISLTGRQLKSLISLWYTLKNVNFPLGVLHISGGTVTINTSPTQPIQSLLINSAPIDESQNYTMTIHEGLSRALMLIHQQFPFLGLGYVANARPTHGEAWRNAVNFIKTQKNILPDTYLPGLRIRALEPDPGWSERDVTIHYNPGTSYPSLHFSIHNYGLRIFQPTVGPLNWTIEYKTPQQSQYQVLARGMVPEIAAGGVIDLSRIQIPSTLLSTSAAEPLNGIYIRARIESAQKALSKSTTGTKAAIIDQMQSNNVFIKYVPLIAPPTL